VFSKRDSFLFLLAAVLAVVLLVPSFTARAFVSFLILAALVIFIARGVLNRSKLRDDASERLDEGESTIEAQQESFALGKLFEATINGMREGLLVVNKEMQVVASNNAAHQLFNLSGGKLNAQRLTELTRNPAIYSAFLDGLKGVERSGVKVETHSPDRIFDLRVVPLASSHGHDETEGALGVFIDVTRIERLELVRQEFLSNVSHELRTPLTAILAFVETLEASGLDDKENSERFLAIIRKNALRMHDLINDILELSAIEAGNVPVKRERVQLSPLVTEVVSSLAGKATANAIVVTNAVPRDAMVYADARRLEQMLTNLIENAIKFNRPNGQVRVSFESGPRDRIVVQDTGEGIPAQHIERLFERFYRVDRARSREMGGTGLGLAIVKHLARAHGGEVTVKSKLSEGSAFTIELPREVVSEMNTEVRR
jgi:two-component system phosphate regulon sensor histidine kinase PhoR